MPNASFLSLALLAFSTVLAGLPARGIPSMRITQPAEGAVVTTAPFTAMAVAEGFQPAWAGLMERVTAADINDAGQIVGYGYRDYDYAPRAFRLTPTVPRALYGDADGDGAVTVRDAASILRASAGLGPAVNVLAADVAPAAACSAKGFGDGLADIADAICVLRHVLSPEPVWP